jgi:hypothetical protein
MADAKKVMTLEVDMETGEITKQLTEVKEQLEDIGTEAEGVGKKGTKGFGGLNKALKLGKVGFRLLGKAMLASGVGAIAALFGGLVAKLMQLKPVTDAVEKAMAFLGGAFKVLSDLVMPLGDTLIDAFNNPQEALTNLREKFIALGDYLKTLLDASINPVRRGLLNIKRAALEAAIGTKEFFGGDASELKQSVREVDEQLADLVVKQEENKEKLKEPFVAVVTFIREEVVPAIVENGTAAVDLADKFIKLRDAQRALNLEQATSRAEIQELKRQSDDFNLSIEDRIAAAQKAAAQEEELRQKRQGLIENEISLLRQKQAIQGESEERTQRINELQIEQQAIIEEGLGLQTELMTKTQGLERELEDARIAFTQAQKDRETGLATFRATQAQNQTDIRRAEQAQELADLAAHYDEQLRQAERYGFDTTQLLATQQAEVEAMQAKHRADDLAAENELRQQKLDLAVGVLGAMQQLNDAFAGKDKQAQKRAFKRNKALSIATTVIQTAQAIMAQLSVPQDALTGANFVKAGIAAATGAAQIATIAKSRFNPDSGGEAGGDIEAPASSGGGGGGGGSTAAPPPTLDLSFLGDGASTNLQAFVLSNEVTTSQQQDQLISDQASLPG